MAKQSLSSNELMTAEPTAGRRARPTAELTAEPTEGPIAGPTDGPTAGPTAGPTYPYQIPLSDTLIRFLHTRNRNADLLKTNVI